MSEDHYKGPGPEQRIDNRLKGSNDHATADHKTTHGHGDRRTITTIHHSGSNKAHAHMPMSPLSPDQEGNE